MPLLKIWFASFQQIPPIPRTPLVWLLALVLIRFRLSVGASLMLAALLAGIGARLDTEQIVEAFTEGSTGMAPLSWMGTIAGLGLLRALLSYAGWADRISPRSLIHHLIPPPAADLQELSQRISRSTQETKNGSWNSVLSLMFWPLHLCPALILFLLRDSLGFSPITGLCIAINLMNLLFIGALRVGPKTLRRLLRESRWLDLLVLAAGASIFQAMMQATHMAPEVAALCARSGPMPVIAALAGLTLLVSLITGSPYAALALSVSCAGEILIAHPLGSPLCLVAGGAWAGAYLFKNIRIAIGIGTAAILFWGIAHAAR
jgi:H+/gluconate symporter-like permease